MSRIYHAPRSRTLAAAIASVAGVALVVALVVVGGGCAKKPTPTATFPSDIPTTHEMSKLGTGTGTTRTPPTKTEGPSASGDWVTPAGDLQNTRFSTLDQINAGNVKNLRVISEVTTGIPHGHEGNPLYKDGTLYVVTPFPNRLFALDMHNPTGPVKWAYDPYPDPRSVGIACCDVVQRGASLADGKVIYSLLDNTVVAVDAQSGKEAWRTKVGNVDVGETITMAPVVAKDLVIVGNSGGELGVRGKVTALDVHDGHVVWVGYNTGPDKDVLINEQTRQFYEQERGKDLGVSTWPPDQWKLGGSTMWGWVSYDPELDVVYYGSGNPGVWNPDLRPGDNKWSCSIFARNRKDGTVRWVHQIGPHDEWDYDEIMENIVVDMPWKGQMRKLLLHPARQGFMYVLDRETGEVLSAEKFEPINFADRVDMKLGVPVVNADKHTHFGVNVKGICPSSTGAKEVFPSAFSPKTGLLYIPAHNTCMDYEGVDVSYIAGTPYLGASVTMYQGDKDYQGEVVAWDVANSKRVWSKKEPKFPVNGGVLATAGDVVFYGTMDGWFRALDARTGDELFRQKLASGVVANPMTFLGPDGKQYIAIYAGIGGWMGAAALPSVSVDDTGAALGITGAMQDIKAYTQPGGVVYLFALPDNSTSPNPPPPATTEKSAAGNATTKTTSGSDTAPPTPQTPATEEKR